MRIITDFKNCTGCRACEQKCNKKAISMQDNAEGFLYPNINETLCNQCGLCEKICPMFRDDLQSDVLETFAAKSLNREQVLKSASGGIFPVLAESILEQNGVVFGCAYDENLVAKHIAIENLSELHKLQSSKYVQSDTLNTYKQAKAFLEQNRKVLYSGTPCQIAGLKAFYGKDCENLITVDLICHGVPSPKLFAKYIDWLYKRMGGKIIEYNFRTKEQGGWVAVKRIKARTKTKVKYFIPLLDPYFLAFAENKTLRECCYSCKYAYGKRASDLTIGDYWGIEKMHPDFFSRDGVSAVLINTHKGKKIWRKCSNKIKSIQSSFENIIKNNLKSPPERPISRNFIYNMEESIFKISFSTKLSYYLNYSLRRLKRLTPNKIKQKITIKNGFIND